MRNLRLVFAAVLTSVLVLPLSVTAFTTIYDNDYSGWNAAVGGSYYTENFDDTILNPDLTVVSTYPGYIDTSRGVWWDRLVYTDNQTTTTWEFAVPIYAFGGTWNPGQPGGPGSSIEVLINGSWTSVGVIYRSYINVFWGFVSDAPFTQVRLKAYNGQGWCETYELDDLVYSYWAVEKVNLDIKPGSCPNPLNVNSKGVLPIAVLGIEDFDVSSIDSASLRLQGVAPLRSSYEDVASPLPDDAEGCVCTTEGPDGYPDLTLKFNVQEIITALGEVDDGDSLELTLTGKLADGTHIEGKDCVVIISKGKNMPDLKVLEMIVTKIVDMQSEGLLDGFDQEKLNIMIEDMLKSHDLYVMAEPQQQEDVVQVQGENNGADLIRIYKKEQICRVIGEDVQSGMPITSCFYGQRVDTTTYKNGEEITNIRILAFEELYLGGTYTNGVYNHDGQFIGKFRKFFKYNDHANVFWKVEVGLNGSTLEFCTMRDMEYSDKSRTKEACESLNIDIQ